MPSKRLVRIKGRSLCVCEAHSNKRCQNEYQKSSYGVYFGGFWEKKKMQRLLTFYTAVGFPKETLGNWKQVFKGLGTSSQFTSTGVQGSQQGQFGYGVANQISRLESCSRCLLLRVTEIFEQYS
jgi:hypothetical protein